MKPRLKTATVVCVLCGIRQEASGRTRGKAVEAAERGALKQGWITGEYGWACPQHAQDFAACRCRLIVTS